LPGIKPVRFDRGDDVGRLERDDEIVVADRFGDLDVAQGTVHHGGRTGEAVLHGEFAFQAAGVDADAHWDAFVLGFLEH